MPHVRSAEEVPRIDPPPPGPKRPRYNRWRMRLLVGVSLLLGAARAEDEPLTTYVSGDPEAALRALLSKTAPDTIGGSFLWIEGARWFGPKDGPPLEVRVVRSRDRLRMLPRAFRPEFAILPKRSGYDEPLELGPQAYVAVWTNREAKRRELEQVHNPVIRKGVFRWPLRVEETERSHPGAPGLGCIFELPRDIRHMEIELDERLACVVDLDEQGEFLPEGEAKRIDVGDGVCVLYANGAYLWLRPKQATRCGVLPAKLRADPDAAALRPFLASTAK